MMIKNERKIYIWVVLLLVLLAVILPVWANSQARIAYAAEATYSNVLDDLERDASFDISYYPDNADDNSLKVITIAESEDNELFVYVYQPSAKTCELTATSIDISTSIYDEQFFNNYHLKLLNRKGVFGKYLVEGLEIEPKGTRFYSITDILRPFDENLDEGSDVNEINEVTFPVAKQWKIGELNGKEFMQVVDIETITITEKMHGFVRYPDGWDFFNWEACDSHFVAFNTDRQIDELLEADVFYTWQNWEQWTSGYIGTNGGWLTSKDDPTFFDGSDNKGEKVVQLNCDQQATFDGDSLFSKSFSWKRIQTIDEFVQSAEFNDKVYHDEMLDVSLGSQLDEAAKEEIKKYKWVLRFTETPYTINSTHFVNSERNKYTGTIVGEVKILRLKFVTDGVTYNLGAIDNKQTGSSDPVNDFNYDVETAIQRWIEDFLNMNVDWLTKVLRVLAIIAGVVVGLVVLGLFVRLCRFIKRLFGKRKADYKYQYSRKRRR